MLGVSCLWKSLSKEAFTSKKQHFINVHAYVCMRVHEYMNKCIDNYYINTSYEDINLWNYKQ